MKHDIEDIYDTSYEFSKEEMINYIMFYKKEHTKEELRKQSIEYIRELWVNVMQHHY